MTEKSKKIMIIDDEADIQMYLSAALEDHGYVPVSVEDDAVVLDAVLKEEPDLIVLDIMMPKRSGISIYTELRSNRKTCPIPTVLMSGLETSKGLMTDELIEMIDNETIDPPDGFIEKPIRLGDFLEMVSKLIP